MEETTVALLMHVCIEFEVYTYINISRLCVQVRVGVEGSELVAEVTGRVKTIFSDTLDSTRLQKLTNTLLCHFRFAYGKSQYYDKLALVNFSLTNCNYISIYTMAWIRL